jgi:hypothetical protein
MKQQTAVKWLVEEINKQKAWANPQQLEPLIDYALKKEKEQIINTHKIGWEDCQEYIKTIGQTTRKGKRYYNETFKK